MTQQSHFLSTYPKEIKSFEELSALGLIATLFTKPRDRNSYVAVEKGGNNNKKEWM
jgi:hypothetical protein